MSAPNISDFATSVIRTVPSPLTSGNTLKITPGDEDLYPEVPFDAILHPRDIFLTESIIEKVIVTAIDGDEVTITRAQSPTTAKQVRVGWRLSATVFASHVRGAYDRANHTGTQPQSSIVGLIVALGDKLEKGSLFFLLKDYGAIANDGIDHTAAIQAACDAAGAARGWVIGEPGTYTIDGAINVTDGMRAWLYGIDFKLIDNSVLTSSVVDNIFKAEEVGDFIIEGLTIDGNRGNQMGVLTPYNIYVAGCTSGIIRDVQSINSPGVGVHSYNNNKVFFEDIRSGGHFYHAFEIEQSIDCSFNNIYGYATDGHGCLVSPGEIGGTGSRGNRITNFFFEDNEYGIAFNAANGDMSAFLNRGNSFAHGTISNSRVYGVNLYKQDYAIFEDVYIVGANRMAIYGYQSAHNMFSGITIEDCCQQQNNSYDAILFEGASSGHASAGNMLNGIKVIINESTNKARYIIRESAAGDLNTYDNVEIIGAPATGNYSLATNSRFDHVDMTSDQTIAGDKIFQDGVGVAFNSVVPAGAAGGMDAPFGVNSPFRILGRKGVQIVVENGAYDVYVGVGGATVNTFSAYVDHTSVHGFPLQDLPTPTLGGDATNKTYVDGLASTNDALVVHKAGTETITGAKTFSAAVTATSITGNSNTITLSGTAPTMDFSRPTTATSKVVRFTTAGLTGSTVQQVMFAIEPTVSQTSTASYLAFLINVTESGVGSGTKLLADWQVGGSTKFSVSSTGIVNTGSSIISQGQMQATSFAPTSSAVPTNGMYRSATNTLGFATNTTLQMQVDASGNLGFGTVSPTNTITLDSTRNGIALFNTVDQITNYEKGLFSWNTNNLTLAVSKGGSGTNRSLILSTFAGTFALNTDSAGSGAYVFNHVTAGSANSTIVRIQGTQTQSSGSNYTLHISPVYNQTGTASYAVIFANATETAVGSGAHYLMQLQLGTVDKFRITNAGDVSFASSLTMPTGRIAVATGAVLGDQPTALVDIGASTVARAHLRLRSGVAPTTPNDGDVWFDGANIKAQVGGVTKTFTLV